MTLSTTNPKQIQKWLDTWMNNSASSYVAVTLDLRLDNGDTYTHNCNGEWCPDCIQNDENGNPRVYMADLDGTPLDTDPEGDEVTSVPLASIKRLAFHF